MDLSKLSLLLTSVCCLPSRLTWVVLLLMGCFTVQAAAQQPIVLLLSAAEQTDDLANRQLVIGAKRLLPSDQLFKVVRVDDFQHFRAAWHAVEQLNPRLVIGPLHKSDVDALIKLSPKFPVISLNQSSLSHPLVWQFAWTPESSVYQLALHLAEKNIVDLLSLSMNSRHATRLVSSFLAVTDVKLVDRLIYLSSDQLTTGLYALTGYNKSRRRIQALEALLETPLVAMPWLRQDVEALVLFAPLADAVEVSQRVDYAWGQSFSLFWVDTGSNGLRDYVRSLPNWGRMKSFMPWYQVEAMQQKRSVNDSFFTALGEDAMRLALIRLSHPSINAQGFMQGARIQGSLGYLSKDTLQRIQLRLPLVWLGDGAVEVIDEDSFGVWY